MYFSQLTSRIQRLRAAALRIFLIAGVATPLFASAAAAQDRGFTLPTVPPNGAPGDSWSTGSVVVTAIRFDGNVVVPTTDLDAIATPFLNRKLRIAEIEELRQRVTRHYVERGHVNSGALIPADAYREGVLRVQIVEGRITEVRLRGMDGLSDAYVTSRLDAGSGTLDVNMLQERIRLLLADPLFERINARLAPGATLGSAIAEVDVARAPTVHAQVFANNYLAPSLGSGLFGINGVVRDITGWGDAVEATAQSSGHTDHYELSWAVPLLATRTVLDVRFGRGDSVIVEEPFSLLNIRSIVDTSQVGLSHPVIADTRRQLNLGITWGERRNRTTLDGEPFSFSAGEVDGKTTVRDWSFYQDYAQRFDRHVLALRSTFVLGRNNLTDNAVPGQPPRNYRLWVGQIQTLSNLNDTGTQLVLRGNLQYTSDRLVPLERLGIGGRHSVRGYRENQLVRDTGYVVNVELVQPLLRDETRRLRLNLVPFIDLGRGSNQDEPHSRLASLGIGFQGQWGGLDGEIFFARHLKTPIGQNHKSLQDQGIHLQVRYAFM